MRNLFSEAWRRGLLLLALPLAMAGAARADEVTDWHEHMLTSLRTAGLGAVNPIVSTRDAALVSAAVFDAVNGIERRYEPIHVPADAPRGASKRAAAVEAACTILLARMPASQAADLNAKRAASLAAIGGSGESVERGVEWGHFVAEAMLAWRSTDGFTPPPPPYFGGNEPGRWRPTSVTPAGTPVPGAAPQFATMTPWGIDFPSQFRPAGPPALSSDQYRVEFDEVRLMGSINTPIDIRSAAETDDCKFWASTSGTYFWNRVALDLLADQGGNEGEDEDGEEGTGGDNLSDNARLLARLNLAVADGLIACWDAKYHFEFWRPVTAIRLEDADGDGNADEPDWTPHVVTPSFPEYTSGHSSVAGAAVAVLADHFGEESPFMLESQTNTSWVRFYPNFTAAIDDVADARVFAGIHFRAACDEGVAVSREVAAYILDNRMQRSHGEGEDDEDSN